MGIFDAPKHHFHETAQDIRLEGWTLWAKLQRLDGSWNVAQLRLNYFLGNDDGNVQWNGKRVAESAKDQTLVFRDGFPIVRASLRDNHDNYHETEYNLSDGIGNSNGNFIFRYQGDTFITTSNPDKLHAPTGYRGIWDGRILPLQPWGGIPRGVSPES